VGDKDIRQPELLLQILEQVDDLRLNGNVQSRYGFVQDYQLGIECERPRNADSLALPAGKLVRIPVCMRSVKPDNSQKLCSPPLQFGAFCNPVNQQGLANHLTHGHPRVER
jgi:hypothetical protein